MRWLNAREWLEHERLTGLPTADLAGEALGLLDQAEASEDIIQTLEYDLDRPDDIKLAVTDLLAFREAVMDVLIGAGVSDGEDLTPRQASGLLRMFLPS